MKNWLVLLVAGLVALLGGLVAIVSPQSFGAAAVTLTGWALIVIAVLQGWAAWKSANMAARLGAGAMATAALLLGVSLLFGPFGDGGLMRILLGLLLLVSGGGKLWVGYTEMRRALNYPLFMGSGGVSVLLGLLVLIGIGASLGTLLGVELLASGLALVLLALRQKNNI